MPARKNPVAKRRTSSAAKLSPARRIAAFAIAPAVAHRKNTMRGEKRSASAKNANTRVPAMKPSCTAEVM
jgi:hypothetical protein